MTLKRAYILLVFAILTEVFAVKASMGAIWGLVCMYALLVLSYYFMALSLKRISVGVAYAIWEVLGAVCVVCISVFYFGEELLWTQKVGIILSISGIALINYAELKREKEAELEVRLEAEAKAESAGADSAQMANKGIE